MNAHRLIAVIKEAGASSDAEILATLKDSTTMGYVFGLTNFDLSNAKIITAHYKALRVVKTACKIVKGDTK